MRPGSSAISLLLVLVLVALEGCTPARIRDGWQGAGRRWFEAEVLTGFDEQGNTVATLAVSLPYRNLVFFRRDGEFVARYTIDAVQRVRGSAARAHRFEGEVVVEDYAKTREALIERKTVRLELVSPPAERPQPIEVVVQVAIDGTQRTDSTVLRVTPERLADGGIALGELSLYQLRDPLAGVPRTRLEVGAQAVPDATIFSRATFGGFDVATGAPWVLVRIFDLSPEAGDGTHQLRLEVVGVENRDHLWTQEIPVPRQGVETGVLLQLPPEALVYGDNRLAVTVPEAKRRTVEIRDFGLDLRDDDSWKAVVRQIELLAGPEELDRLREAPPERRDALWTAFWDRRDPEPQSPGNERLREHYGRVRHARRTYADGFGDGALSDRGRVFVLHGPPASVYQAQDQVDILSRWEVWTYTDPSIIYYFQLAYGTNYRLVWREDY